MSARLFEVLIRKAGQGSPLEAHEKRVDGIIATVERLLVQTDVFRRLKVTSRLDDDVGEWLQFDLDATPQTDLFRKDTNESSQVTQEAADLGRAVRSKIHMLQELVNEVSLTPSRFWEILRSGGFKPGDLGTIKVARGLPTKKLHLVDANGAQYALWLGDLPSGSASEKLVDLSIEVKYVSDNEAVCRILSVGGGINVSRRKMYKVFWPTHDRGREIAHRFVDACCARRPILMKAHHVCNSFGEVYCFEFAGFVTFVPARAQRSKQITSVRDWSSGAGWPVPLARGTNCASPAGD